MGRYNLAAETVGLVLYKSIPTRYIELLDIERGNGCYDITTSQKIFVDPSAF